MCGRAGGRAGERASGRAAGWRACGRAVGPYGWALTCCGGAVLPSAGAPAGAGGVTCAPVSGSLRRARVARRAGWLTCARARTRAFCCRRHRVRVRVRTGGCRASAAARHVFGRVDRAHRWLWGRSRAARRTRRRRQDRSGRLSLSSSRAGGLAGGRVGGRADGRSHVVAGQDFRPPALQQEQEG